MSWRAIVRPGKTRRRESCSGVCGRHNDRGYTLQPIAFTYRAVQLLAVNAKQLVRAWGGRTGTPFDRVKKTISLNATVQAYRERDTDTGCVLPVRGGRERRYQVGGSSSAASAAEHLILRASAGDGHLVP